MWGREPAFGVAQTSSRKYGSTNTEAAEIGFYGSARGIFLVLLQETPDTPGKKPFDIWLIFCKFGVMTVKRANASWYEEWFGEDYLKVYPHRDEAEARQQVDFVASVLDLTPEDRILDLGCGGGRHANDLARRGFDVTCLDLSAVLLSLARKKYGTESCCLRFVRADMRNIPFKTVFDKVLSFFTTFGYFETDAENLQTWLNIQNVLKSGGRFFQDYLNKSYVLEHLVPIDMREEGDFLLRQERFYDRTSERIEKKITLKENGETREYFESVRLYTLDEMQQLLTKTELELENVYGDFDGSAFTPASPRLLLVGRRRRS